MNEFTKQELEQLSFAIYTYPHPDDNYIYDGLRSKIKAMIDNYCEHELCHIDYDHQPIRCKRCKEIVE